MTPPDYEYLRKFLKEHSGLDLSAGKEYPIESRLPPLSQKSGLAGIGELAQKIKRGCTDITAHVVEAMTTNDGFLALGAAETMVGLTEAFRPYPERRDPYRFNNAGTAPIRIPTVGAVAPKGAMAGI